MAIEFHCDHCGNKVRTPDESAGRRGRCPYCKQSVYIPTPRDQIELLDLAPLDEAHERDLQAMQNETRDIAARLLRDKNTPPETPGSQRGDARHDVIEPRADPQALIVQYAMNMASGDLPAADELAAEIRRDMAAAEQTMDRILMDEVPPAQLARIPRPVLVGFFKRLRQGD
jgi:DNA-directed RNA polymerase subunit RPC12/RpoP